MLQAISEKNGLVMSEMINPIVFVSFLRKLRAIWFGWYPSSSIEVRTRVLRSSLTKRVLLITWLTVETDTPASLATSLIVAMGPLLFEKTVCANASITIAKKEPLFNHF